MSRSAARGLSIALVLACPIASALPGRAPAQDAPHPAPVVNSSQVPPDVSIPAGSPGNPIAAFDDYSWRAFLAMIWPAQAGVRGAPDTTKTVDGAGPRVFETYKSIDELFHNDGTAPTAWDQFDPPKYNPCGMQAAWGDMALGSANKFGNLAEAGFLGTLVGPLIAQNKTYTRYLTSYNKVEFDNILQKKWYLRANLPVAPAFATFDLGALDVKSAWVDMTGIANPGRFYTRVANVLDPTNGECKPLRVGLVGLHIVQKTPSRPQWIWSSFEHVDNVPPAAPGSPGTFSFNDGTATPMPPSNPITLDRTRQLPTPPPFNVARVKPIHDSTARTNDDYHGAMASNSIWRNYQLVMTQWPTTASSPTTPGDPMNTFPGVGATTAFANTTLETFDQKTVFASCMACHNGTKAHTDFVWSLNDHAFPPRGSSPALAMKSPSIRALRSVLQLGRGHSDLSASPAPKP